MCLEALKTGVDSTERQNPDSNPVYIAIRHIRSHPGVAAVLDGTNTCVFDVIDGISGHPKCEANDRVEGKEHETFQIIGFSVHEQ